MPDRIKRSRHIITYCTIFISPVQLPLHEPYFDLTLIRTAHMKDPIITSKTYIFTYL